MDTINHAAGADEGDVGMIRDFIKHVRSIIPMLEQVKDSIEESSSRIPKASHQLSEVTTATESATVEILNVLETMADKIGRGEERLKEVRRFVEQNNGTAESSQVLASIAAIEQMLSETKDNSMSIAIALQVQDITSQQIAGVAHTIEAIRLNLGSALKRFDDPEHESPDSNAGRMTDQKTPEHFDGNARFSKSTDRQDLADEIVKQWNQDHV
jgi:chemotaxis regulatin CheY-phosphate phosphatase CheZ